jgi:signal transduction histidine kinase
LNTLLDLDLAIIEDAYQAEHLSRQQGLERLAAIGQLGGGIAHELRNPLNVIKTSLSHLLNARNPSPAKQAEHLKRIERQVGLADGVVSALSNYARMPIPTMTPASIPTCVAEVLADLTLPAGVEGSCSWQDGLPDALGDAAQLAIVLSNLIRNACDAMPQGGKLTITGSENDDAQIHIAVRDTGSGVPPEVLGRIMEPLFTTKAKGLGLGLALSRVIIEKHQGSLSVASRPGEGTTFTMRLRAVSPVKR